MCPWSSAIKLSPAIFRVLLLSLCITSIVLMCANGRPVNVRQLHSRSPGKRDNETNSQSDDDLCYGLFDAENSTFQFSGQTTALFKIADLEESSWEVTMIVDLKERLMARGFNQIDLVIVSPLSESVSWESGQLGANYTLGNVTVTYETEDLEHLPVDSVTVLDSCGLVVYSIFSPWSSLQYPYVKAAVLSAMFDQPCGRNCKTALLAKPLRNPLFDKIDRNDIMLDIEPPEKESRQVSDDPANGVSSSSPVTEEEEEDAGFLVPLRIIIPSEHVHRDTENPFGKFQKYNYYVLKTDNVSFHGHLDSDPPEIVGVWRDLTAGLVPLEEEQKTTTALEGTPTTTETATDSTTNAVSEEEPIFGFPGAASSKITFTTSNDLSPSASVSVSTTPPEEIGTTTQQQQRTTDLLVYVNENRDMFTVRKKYRFGDSAEYNPRNFDEVEVLREDVKTFIQESSSEEMVNRNNARNVDDHYGNIIPWLEFIL